MSVVEKILEDAKQGFVTALRDGKIDSGNLVKVVSGIAKRVNALPIEVEDKKEFLTMALKKAAEAAGASDSDGFAAVLHKAVSAGHGLIDAAKVSSVATLLSLLVSFLSRCLPACSQVAAVTSGLDPKDTELIAAALKAEKAVETVESTLESLTVKVSETGERLVEVAPLKEVQEDTPAPNISDKESSPEASPVEVPVLNIRSEALD